MGPRSGRILVGRCFSPIPLDEDAELSQWGMLRAGIHNCEIKGCEETKRAGDVVTRIPIRGLIFNWDFLNVPSAVGLLKSSCERLLFLAQFFPNNKTLIPRLTQQHTLQEVSRGHLCSLGVHTTTYHNIHFMFKCERLYWLLIQFIQFILASFPIQYATHSAPQLQNEYRLLSMNKTDWQTEHFRARIIRKLKTQESLKYHPVSLIIVPNNCSIVTIVILRTLTHVHKLAVKKTLLKSQRVGVESYDLHRTIINLSEGSIMWVFNSAPEISIVKVLLEAGNF